MSKHMRGWVGTGGAHIVFLFMLFIAQLGIFPVTVCVHGENPCIAS